MKVLRRTIFFLVCLSLVEILHSEDISPGYQDFDSDTPTTILPSPNQKKYEEQISCDESCTKISFTSNDTGENQVWDAFGKNAGKILVEINEPFLKLDDPKLEDYLEYLREISKRQGTVHFEPYYIGYKGFGLTDLPILKDMLGVSYNIYKRLRSFFVFGRLKAYNAKVLYHPQKHHILLIFFYHKNYGNLCDTVYATCATIQYLDDETFDLNLAKSIQKISANQPIEIRFDQTPAELPQTRLNLEHLLAVNRSARIYKWLILSRSTEVKPEKRERFLDLGLIVSLLDYSLQAYEMVEAIQMYWPIRSLKTEVLYEDRNEGRLLRSIVVSKP
ncbi:hypothetical protein LPTSP4_14130 [Leptospira ryugenii]|uniref:Uncharacterized protein n=1 Tax=Leptospira ryugenii TaxID=1917863 RepID=A0A2P2DZ48_9LEPT|nr:hypothetical protein [Leptospira ryugenii]GBF49893.1 hypothetical protein LPTSP4_14130 [Leptospira ryugenii]